MWWIIPVVGIVAMFGVPTYVLKRYFDLRERRLALDEGSHRALSNQVAALQAAKDELEQRVGVLESIVVEGDFELNRRLSRLKDTPEAPALAGGPPGAVKRLPPGSG